MRQQGRDRSDAARPGGTEGPAEPPEHTQPCGHRGLGPPASRLREAPWRLEAPVRRPRPQWTAGSPQPASPAPGLCGEGPCWSAPTLPRELPVPACSRPAGGVGEIVSRQKGEEWVLEPHGGAGRGPGPGRTAARGPRSPPSRQGPPSASATPLPVSLPHLTSGPEFPCPGRGDRPEWRSGPAYLPGRVVSRVTASELCSKTMSPWEGPSGPKGPQTHSLHLKNMPKASDRREIVSRGGAEGGACQRP